MVTNTQLRAFDAMARLNTKIRRYKVILSICMKIL